MKKGLIIVGGIIIIIIVAGILIIGSNLGSIVKKAVNEYGPGITKTELRLGEAKVSVLSGSVELEDLFLGNPKGYKGPYALKVQEIELDVDLKSLMGDTIVIKKIKIDSPDINYEKTPSSDNFQTIIRNVTASSKKEKRVEKEKKGKEGAGKKVYIKDLIIEDAKVLVSMPAVKRSVSAELPDIHIRNIGSENQGVLPAEAVQKVMAVLYKKLTSPEMTNLLKENLKSLGKELESAKSPEEASKIIKGFLGK